MSCIVSFFLNSLEQELHILHTDIPNGYMVVRLVMELRKSFQKKTLELLNYVSTYIMDSKCYHLLLHWRQMPVCLHLEYVNDWDPNVFPCIHIVCSIPIICNICNHSKKYI